MRSASVLFSARTHDNSAAFNFDNVNSNLDLIAFGQFRPSGKGWPGVQLRSSLISSPSWRLSLASRIAKTSASDSRGADVSTSTVASGPTILKSLLWGRLCAPGGIDGGICGGPGAVVDYVPTEFMSAEQVLTFGSYYLQKLGFCNCIFCDLIGWARIVLEGLCFYF